MASKLNLNKREHNITISGISQSTSRVNYSIKAVIKSQQNDFTANVEFLILSRITDILPSEWLPDKNSFFIMESIKDSTQY